MRQVCYYHGGDFDGICSAAIVRHFVGEDVELRPVNYHDNIPDSDLQGWTEIYVVDFSFKPETMKMIHEGNDAFFWIDHHKTAIEANDTKYLGSRVIGKAACELCWEYFSPDPMPCVVKLLGRYDVWDHQNTDVLPFQYGLRASEEMRDPRDSDWTNLFRGVGHLDFIDIGQTILDYQDDQNKIACKAGAHWLIFEGQMALVCNTAIHGSRFYKSMNPALCISYNQLADKRWKVSLYSDSGIDCGALAKKHGGGGHAGAAGFTCEELPWA